MTCSYCGHDNFDLPAIDDIVGACGCDCHFSFEDNDCCPTCECDYSVCDCGDFQN